MNMSTSNASTILDLYNTTTWAPEENFEHVPEYITVYITVINALIFCVGLFGNTMVIVVVCRVREMRNPTNHFLFTLSIADLCVLIICQPVAMMEFYTKDRWYLGAIMCKLVPLLENGMLHVSILTMIAMTTERFHSIVYPFRNLSNCSDTLTFKIIIAVWIIAFICTSPFLFITTLEDAVFFDGTYVKVCRTIIHRVWHKAFVVINNIAFFLLPFCILTYMYSRIINRLMSERLSTSMTNEKSARLTLIARRQVVRTLILIIVLFFFSMCPIRLASLWLIFTPAENIAHLGIETYYNIMWFARLMMYVNSAGNPVIYSMSSSKFKRAFRRVFSEISRRSSPPPTTKVLYRATRTTKPGYSNTGREFNMREANRNEIDVISSNNEHRELTN